MIAGLIGRIHRIDPDAVRIDVNGVIYRVNTTTRTGEEAGGVGARIEVFTHMVVREDAQILFGFLTERELGWFETLLGVNGVGPRLACAVLSRFRPEELLDVIAAEEVSLLSTVPGVGKRTASRILLDLRGKLPMDLERTGSMPGSADGGNDVIGALQALGYTTAEAMTALKKLPAEARDASVEDQVVAALRLLGGV
ncbi:MAG TPA: Holliday junction branch migration protein RuvA [Thermomicrobiales bacterium]|nr:Holliday junction branch migration protein RuvA [Thermomicrobiales bacterium]